MKKQNLKVDYKSTQLISILSQHLTGKMNLARIITFVQGASLSIYRCLHLAPKFEDAENNLINHRLKYGVKFGHAEKKIYICRIISGDYVFASKKKLDGFQMGQR